MPMMYRFAIAGMCLLGMAMPAAAQDVKAAQTFLTGLYAGYAKGKKPLDVIGKDIDRIFTPELAALIKADLPLQIDGVGPIDGDVICNCQDWDKFSVTGIDVTPDGPKGAKATVAFTNAGSARTVRYQLALVEGKWRVANLSEEGFDDFRKTLADDIVARVKDIMK